MVDYLERNVAEFAARWRRELAPDQVKIGKQLSKELGQNKEKFKQIDSSARNSSIRKGRVKNQEKFVKIQDKINQVSNTANAQKASLNLLAGNKADPLIKQNKNLRSYLENRKVKQGTNSNVLSKPYQAPKTIKRAARRDANVFQKGIRDNPKRLAEIKAKQPQIPQSAPYKPVAPKDIPNPLGSPKPTVSPNLSVPKPQGSGLLKSVVRKNKILTGVGAGVGVAALGAGIYHRMKKNKNK